MKYFGKISGAPEHLELALSGGKEYLQRVFI